MGIDCTEMGGNRNVKSIPGGHLQLKPLLHWIIRIIVDFLNKIWTRYREHRIDFAMILIQSEVEAELCYFFRLRVLLSPLSLA